MLDEGVVGVRRGRVDEDLSEDRGENSDMDAIEKSLADHHQRAKSVSDFIGFFIRLTACVLTVVILYRYDVALGETSRTAQSLALVGKYSGIVFFSAISIALIWMIYEIQRSFVLTFAGKLFRENDIAFKPGKLLIFISYCVSSVLSLINLMFLLAIVVAIIGLIEKNLGA